MAEETTENTREEFFVNFDCWSCSAAVQIDIYAVQQERIDIDYSQIRPNPDDPQRYYLKCTECNKFNAVFL